MYARRHIDRSEKGMPSMLRDMHLRSGGYNSPANRGEECRRARMFGGRPVMHVMQDAVRLSRAIALGGS